MKNAVLLFFMILMGLASRSWAQVEQNAEDQALTDTFTQEELEEIDSLKQGTVLKRRNVKTGLFMKDYNTYEDKNRTSFIYHVNNDLTALTNIQTLEFNYAHRFELAWVEFFGLRTAGKFAELTDNNPSDGADTDELRDTDDQVLAFGAAISYRSDWVQELVGSDKMFTTTSAGLGWYNYTQNLRVKSYSGPGLKCDFGLHRRSSRSFHYGLKMSYHLADVKRAAEFEGETSSQRNQVLSWLTFGFDLSFYF